MDKDKKFYLPTNDFRDLHYKGNRNSESPDSVYSKSLERAKLAFDVIGSIVKKYECDDLFSQLYELTDIYTEKHIYYQYFEKFEKIKTVEGKWEDSKRPSNIFPRNLTNKSRQKSDFETLLKILSTDISYIKKIKIEWTDAIVYEFNKPNFNELFIEHDIELIKLLFKNTSRADLEGHFDKHYKDYEPSKGGRPVVKSRTVLRAFANKLNLLLCENTSLKKKNVRSAILDIINNTYLGAYYEEDNSDIEFNREWLSKNLTKTGSN